MNPRAALALGLSLLIVGAVPHPPPRSRAVASFGIPATPMLPGSVIPLSIDGLTPPYGIELLGTGHLNASSYVAPERANGPVTLVAANQTAVATRTLVFAPPPAADTAFIAVASYDDGVVIHDAAPPFARRSILGVGGAPADVTIDPQGRIAAGATDGTTAVIATIAPWSVQAVEGVPFSDEAAFDDKTQAAFFTDRDTNGAGAITRVSADGQIRTRVLGLTAEGIAIDSKRRRAYVANTNDGTISIVDLDSMVELDRFAAVSRVFSLALNASGSRLYAVSNQSYTSPFGAAGSVIAIDVAATKPRIVAKSAPLAFPVGLALDQRRNRLFVTDERDDDVYVLSPLTLHAVHAPLPTCRTPWKPLVDRGTLYLPCARANEIDAIDTSTFRRRPGAPFATGGYPLAVAVWHPQPNVKR
ncbi:MAG TPA: hypothetical protein VFN49_01290 [Candidatus Aquilonibacter sp.]|nr:hypothetical protein [Candidatus Aquilonibacter sp.]